jgi:hypothetical protein
MHNNIPCFLSLEWQAATRSWCPRERSTSLLQFPVKCFHITLQEYEKSFILQYVSEFKDVFPAAVKVVSAQTHEKSIVEYDYCQAAEHELTADIF